MTDPKGNVDCYFTMIEEGSTFWATSDQLPGFTAAGDSFKDCANRIRAYMKDEYPGKIWCVAGPFKAMELSQHDWLLIKECLVAKQLLLFDLGKSMTNRSMPSGGRVYLHEAAEIELLLKKLMPISPSGETNSYEGNIDDDN